MKRTTLVAKLAVTASLCALAVAAARAADTGDFKNSRARVIRSSAPRERVVFVEVTGSRIPQRVVLSGHIVDSASPLTIYGRNDLFRSGSVDVASSLAFIDPNISMRRR